MEARLWEVWGDECYVPVNKWQIEMATHPLLRPFKPDAIRLLKEAAAQLEVIPYINPMILTGRER